MQTDKGKDGADKGQPAASDSKAMKILRAVAFGIGVILIVLGALGVIELKAGLIAGVVLTGGSAGGPLALKALGVGGS